MPNWCENTLELTFTSEAAADEFVKLAEAEDFGLLNHFVPMPDSVFHGSLGDKERKEHGANNWYDWSVANWGTKWEARLNELDLNGGITRVSDKTVMLEFETAWEPPVKAFEAIESQGLGVYATFYEPGMNFQGTFMDNTLVVEEL